MRLLLTRLAALLTASKPSKWSDRGLIRKVVTITGVLAVSRWRRIFYFLYFCWVLFVFAVIRPTYDSDVRMLSFKCLAAFVWRESRLDESLQLSRRFSSHDSRMCFVELQIQGNVEWKVKQISQFLYFHNKIDWNLSEKCGKVLYLKNCDVWESCISYRQFSSQRSCRFGRWLLEPGLVLIQVMVSGTGKLLQLFTLMQSDGLLRQHFTNWRFMNSWTWLLGTALRPDCRRVRVSWRTVNMNLLHVTGLELDLFVIILRGVFFIELLFDINKLTWIKLNCEENHVWVSLYQSQQLGISREFGSMVIRWFISIIKRSCWDSFSHHLFT